jgi:hypothetical protein
MERFLKLSDPELDRLLSGSAPAGHADLEALAAFVRQVPDAYAEAPNHEIETVHLARIAEAVHQVLDQAPVERTRERSGRTRRRRAMLSAIFGTLAAKIATVTVAAAATTGGLAATGNLPAPAQDAVASAMSHVGVHFPTSGKGRSDTANEHGKTVSETARTTDKTGREKGQEVSDAASSKSEAHRKDAEHRSAGNPAGKGSPDTPSGNPTGYGQDNHPSGNPTGNGDPSHPSGKP